MFLLMGSPRPFTNCTSLTKQDNKTWKHANWNININISVPRYFPLIVGSINWWNQASATKANTACNLEVKWGGNGRGASQASPGGLLPSCNQVQSHSGSGFAPVYKVQLWPSSSACTKPDSVCGKVQQWSSPWGSANFEPSQFCGKQPPSWDHQLPASYTVLSTVSWCNASAKLDGRAQRYCISHE